MDKIDVLNYYSTRGTTFLKHVLSLMENSKTISALKNTIVKIGFRIQVRKSGLKVRQIYILPFQIIALEIFSFQKLLSHFDHNMYQCYSKTDVFTDLIVRIDGLNRCPGELNLQTDYSSMDLSCPQYLIEFMFD
jgi:hypothetical protein